MSGLQLSLDCVAIMLYLSRLQQSVQSQVEILPSSAGLMALLLQFSFANWIISYLTDNQLVLLSPFAANWHIGEFGEGRRSGGEGGAGGANRFGFAMMYPHATHGEMCNHLMFHCELPLAVAMRRQ